MKHSRNGKDELKQLASNLSFELVDVKRTDNVLPTLIKRIMFVIDCSRSMSGVKIYSAVKNLRNIFSSYVNNDDEIGLIGFNNNVHLIKGLTKKKGNEVEMERCFDQLLSVGGRTALYDAIKEAYDQFVDLSSNTNNDWIVVLTDGMIFMIVIVLLLFSNAITSYL